MCRMVVFEALRPQLPAGYSLYDFLLASSDFEFWPVFVAGKCVGAIMQKGPVVHAAVLPEARGKWFNKRTLQWVKNQANKYGRLETKVRDAHGMGHAFAKRLGFVETSKANGLTYYEKVAS